MKEKRLRILIISLAIISFQAQLFSLLAQESYEELKEDYTKKIEKDLKKKNIAGASLLLFDGDSIIWEEYFGYADSSKQIPVNEKTLFKIGSVTKVFTATSLMQHVQSGKLDLDAPVTNYMPDFNIKQRFPESGPITTRMVLTHHAGLPSDIIRGFSSDSLPDFRSELELLNQEYTIFPAGYIRAYSNPGYNLAGILSERVGGESYRDLIHNRIFRPLGMNDSRIWGVDKDLENLSANFDKNGEAVSEPYIREVPAGAIVSNVRDMSAFLMEWVPTASRDIILEPVYRNEMFRTQNQDVLLDLNSEYGLGWAIKHNHEVGKIYQHSGATLYQHAVAGIAPESGLGIVILTNSNRGSSICNLYDNILASAARIKGISKADKGKTTSKTYNTKKRVLSEEKLEELTGYYSHPGLFYTIRNEKGKPRTEIQGMDIKMIPVSDTGFIPRIKLFGPLGFKIKKVRFYLTEIAGNQMLIQEQTVGGRQNLIGVKIEEVSVSDVWRERAGEYEVVNYEPGDYEFFQDFELLFRDDFIVLKFVVNVSNKPEQNSMLIPLSDDLAYVSGLGRQGGYAVQVKKDENGNELLYYSGHLLRKK